jgi:hypothetical protein
MTTWFLTGHQEMIVRWRNVSGIHGSDSPLHQEIA